jgi:hypothetical protein
MQPLVEAIKYTTTVYTSTSDFIHGNGKTVTEVFIPSHAIAFNIRDETINVFILEKPRDNQQQSIMIEQSMVDHLVKIIEIEEQLQCEKLKLKSTAQLYL